MKRIHALTTALICIFGALLGQAKDVTNEIPLLADTWANFYGPRYSNVADPGTIPMPSNGFTTWINNTGKVQNLRITVTELALLRHFAVNGPQGEGPRAILRTGFEVLPIDPLPSLSTVPLADYLALDSFVANGDILTLGYAAVGTGVLKSLPLQGKKTVIVDPSLSATYALAPGDSFQVLNWVWSSGGENTDYSNAVGFSVFVEAPVGPNNEPPPTTSLPSTSIPPVVTTTIPSSVPSTSIPASTSLVTTTLPTTSVQLWPTTSVATTSVPVTTTQPTTTTIPFLPPVTTSVTPTSIPATSSAPPSASTTITSSIPPASLAVVSPVESSQSVSLSGDPADSRRYPRLWQTGGQWHAYLGREGVCFELFGRASGAVQAWDLQAKEPGASVWSSIASKQLSNSLKGAFQLESLGLASLRLGEVSRTSVLVPLSYEQGRPLTGAWSFRARVQGGAGDWSPWSEEVAVEVELPVTVKAQTVQTLPPGGSEGAWFEASKPREFVVRLWIP